jgi:hypothetical protein
LRLHLISYCAGNAEATDWLERRWWPQELQHGLALRRYIQTVWPQFDWDSVYEYFFMEFAIISISVVITINTAKRRTSLAVRC